MSKVDGPRVSYSLVDSILLATDFSETSRPAFAYALALSLLRQTSLTLLHVGEEQPGTDGWTKFPPVRATLEKWRLLEPGSVKSDVFKTFAVKVKKVDILDRRPARAIVQYLEREHHDLLVLGTEGRDGLPRWLEPSIAESAADGSSCMTLFVPDGARNFISSETGDLSLRRILVPVARGENPEAALAIAARTARVAQADENVPVEITCLHVGSDAPVAPRDNPDSRYCELKASWRTGDVVNEIIAEANEKKVELIVMTTKGRNSLVDAIRGSTTQQVLRQSPCPLLMLPAGPDRK